MTTAFYMFILFLAKVLDNTLNTAKTILVQRNRCLLAGVALGLSNFIYLSITKDIVTSDSTLALVIVSIASGVGHFNKLRSMYSSIRRLCAFV